MKKSIFASLSVALFLFIYLSNSNSYVMALQPGSSEDPLITRSYLERRLSTLEINNHTVLSDEVLNFIIEDITRRIFSQLSYVEKGTFKPVSANTGQLIIGDEGTEIILRVGSALIFSEVDNGVVNITTGRELLNGDRVDINNKLIVPRDDGRGVFVTEDSWFIIRGNYSINYL